MSSKRRLRRKSCGDKQKHKDQASAVSQIISLKKKGYAVESYKCKFGDHWHVGHSHRTFNRQGVI